MASIYSRKRLSASRHPDFAATATAVGQGEHVLAETAELSGTWSTETVAGSLRGESCAWYAFTCDESQFDATYAVSAAPSGQVDINFNGQSVEITHSQGPDHGIWAVELDGAPYLDDEGQPVEIDAYRETVRYDLSQAFVAESEGEHTLSLINTGRNNPESSGILMSVSTLNVLQPLRASNLGIILGILAGLQLLAALFAWTLGPVLFSGVAERMETKQAIMLALIAYSVIAVWGYFLNAVIEFWFLAWMVSICQGGSQALSRSLYASLSPTARSGEFFGFFSIMSKFASFLAPFVFVISVALFDSSRPGVLSLIFFFGIGMWFLSRVDVAAGIAYAKAKDAELLGKQPT